MLRKRKLFYVHSEGESGDQRSWPQGTARIMFLNEGTRGVSQEPTGATRRMSVHSSLPRIECAAIWGRRCPARNRHRVFMAACPRNGLYELPGPWSIMVFRKSFPAVPQEVFIQLYLSPRAEQLTQHSSSNTGWWHSCEFRATSQQGTGSGFIFVCTPPPPILGSQHCFPVFWFINIICRTKYSPDLVNLGKQCHEWTLSG